MSELFTVLRVVVSLAAVFGLLWWLQRHLAKRGVLSRRAPDVKVTSRTAIGGRAQLVTVEENGVRYLLGVTESGITVMNRRPVSSGTTFVIEPDGDSAEVPETFEAVLAAQDLPRAETSGADDPVRTPPHPAASPGVLYGSILAPSTWKQAGAAIRRAIAARQS